MNTLTVIIRLGIFILILFLIDLYAYQAFKTTFRDSSPFRMGYWIFSGLVWVSLIIAFTTLNRQDGFNPMFMYFMAFMILSLVPKLIVSAFMLIEDVIRLIGGGVQSITATGGDSFLPGRRKFVSQTALLLAAIPFIGVIHGVWRGRYNFRVIRKTLEFAGLPAEFDGLTITQISDVHSGSFDNPKKIQYAIDLINEQQSDLLLFTGDLVNNRADEMEPWVDTFSQLQAPMGKYSILGNHDYGDYVSWESANAKAQNMENLYKVHERIGFRLMRNENLQLERDGGKIDLVGVENWGVGFAQHGDLAKATQNLEKDSFKILMSHDPSHYDQEVKTFDKKIDLTLSGHTHGMQFGIEIPGFLKWSPVSLRYPKWAGLYEEMGRKLYVNRGFGFLAFPGRVGIWPEITVLTLKRGESV
jgi:hypothetical protein